jgi:PilZ domain
MYVQLGEHNGGVILNVSKGGLAVQAATPLIVDQLPPLLFQLSANKWVQARARIAWLTPSKRTAGLQFNDLSETARADIRGWIALEMGDLAQPPTAGKNRSAIDATPQDAIAHAESDGFIRGRCIEFSSA